MHCLVSKIRARLGNRTLVWLFATGMICGWAGASAHAVGGMPEDREIEMAIVYNLSRDATVSAHRIDTKVEDGVATLSGTVNNLLAKERALDLTRSIKGVRAIIDNLEVTCQIV